MKLKFACLSPFYRWVIVCDNLSLCFKFFICHLIIRLFMLHDAILIILAVVVFVRLSRKTNPRVTWKILFR